MLELCATNMSDMKQSRHSRQKHDMDSITSILYGKVQVIAGAGVAHIFALNVMQVAAIFGYLPGFSKTSGAYKAVNGLYLKHVEVLI